jgi:hypothetical protein
VTRPATGRLALVGLVVVVAAGALPLSGSSLRHERLVAPVPESDPLSASVVEETRSRVAAP